MRLSDLSENIWMAFSSLRANKIRALLTTLGIVIGVGATIGITTLTEGMNKSMLNQIDSYGLNFFQLLQYGQSIEFGIQKISPSADAVAICLYHQRKIQGKYQRALLLPAMKPRHQPVSLIASKSFKVGDDVLINKLGFQTKIHFFE